VSDDWIRDEWRRSKGLQARASIVGATAAPDAAARANALARTMGLPAEAVEQDFPAAERQHQAKRAVQALPQSDDYIASWFSQPRNAAAAKAEDVAAMADISKRFHEFWGATDDTITRGARQQARGDNEAAAGADGFLGRGWAFLRKGGSSIEQGLYQLGGALQEWNANNPLPWTSRENTARARDAADQLRNRARLLAGTAPVRGGTSWEDLKAKPSAGNIARFGVEQTIQSLPGMAAAVYALPAYVASQSGSIGQQRAQNNGRSDASIGDIARSTPAAIASALVERFGVERIFGAEAKNLLLRVGKAAATEAGTEAAQSLIEYSGGALGTDQGFRPYDAFDQMLQGAVAGGFAGGSIRAGIESTHSLHRYVRGGAEIIGAEHDAAFVDQVMSSAESVEMRQHDPEGFREFVAGRAEGSPAENLYLPAEQARQLMQSGQHPFLEQYEQQVAEALPLDGDVVIPLADAAAHLAGTPTWEAMREHVRLSPGGMSLSEAQAAGQRHSSELEAAGQRIAEEARAASESPAAKVYEMVRDDLTGAGIAPDAADRYAQIYAANRATWAARLGTDALSYHQANPISFRRVLPPSLARTQAAGSIDLVVNAMRRGAAAPKQGPSLVEWIARNGGIEDKGGDLKAMGAETWHRGKPGRRKLIRPHGAEGQGSMLGAGEQQNANTPDELAARAQEAGYFPAGERPTVNQLLDAIAGELRGVPVRAEQPSRAPRDVEIREAADDLRRILESRGVDPDTATKQEIKSALDAHRDEMERGGRAYSQPANPEIADLIGLAGDPGHNHATVELGAPSDWLIEQAARHGINIAGMQHTIDTAAVRHTLARHGDKAGERSRGQLQVTGSDLEHAGEVLAAPDQVVFGLKNGRGQDMIVHAKRLNDGTTVYIEEVRVGRKRLALASVRRYPGTIAAARLAAVLNPHARSASRDTDLKVVDVLPEGKARVLNQGNDEARGRISLTDSGAVIELFQNADLSTVLHETAHGWLEELQRNAVNGPEDVLADWDATAAWFAEQGHPIGADGVIPTDAHELWARGFERYAMEGKAPSGALRRAFDTFRGWLLQIYRHVDALRAPISPEIRRVFDRMLATQDAIDEEARREEDRALFDDVAGSGMTGAEFTAYRDTVARAKSEAYDALLVKTTDVLRRERTAEWKKQRKRVLDDVTQRVNRQPEHRALHLLRTGSWLGEPDRPGAKVRLSRQWLIDNFGSDALALLPKGVPPIYAEKGVDGDTLAELVGARSGDELVRTLMGMEETQRALRRAGDKRSVRQQDIDEQTQGEMDRRYGDPLKDGSIEDEAVAAINNSSRGELLAMEARVLGRRIGREGTPAQLAQEWAARTIAEGSVIDVASRAAMQRYRRNMEIASRQAEEAFIAGDQDEAFKHKQAQLLNHALLAEATKAAEDVDKIVARLTKIANKATMKSIDQDYLDRAHGMLEAFDFRQRSQKAIDAQEMYAGWADQQRANGVDVMPLPRMASQGTHYSRISVEELRGLDASIEQIMHLGRFKQKLIDQQIERDFDEVVQEAIASAEALPQKPPSNLMDPNLAQRFKSRVASADASLLKMEQIFDWLDSGNAQGVFNRLAFKPIADAQDRENSMLTDYYGRIREAMQKVPKETIRRWTERVSAPELRNRETGEPFVLTRQNLIAAALNVGNHGNLQRLSDGYGWPEISIMTVLNRELSPAEWGFVQETWDIIETLWPDIAAMERRINGIAPDKVKRRAIETSGGRLRGGYYPAIYDSSKDLTAEEHAGKNSDLFETLYTRATTRASATKDRVEKVRRPILLQLGVINRHLGEVIHDITHREAIMNADKFLSSKRVMAAVDKALGPEIRQQFRPWLKFVANQWAIERAGNEGLGWFLNQARANATVVGMGYRFTTILTQVAGFSNSFEKVGAGWVTAAIAKTAAHPIDTFNFAMQRSGELRDRMNTLDRDIRSAIGDLAGKVTPLADAKRFAFHGIGYMDRVVSIPTWLGAYDKAIAGGATEEEAIYEGDKAIRLSQGSGSPKDLAAVQRGTGKFGQAFKLLTMFYSYMSVVYQRNRTLGRDVAQAVRERDVRMTPRLLARAWWLIAVPPVLASILGGHGPDDDEDWGEWASLQMMSQMVGPIPVVRDAFVPMWNKIVGKPGFGYQLSPIQRAVESFVNVADDVGRTLRGDETKHATKDALEATGYATGLVPGQVASAAQFFVDVAHGDQDPQTVADWYRGVTTGKAEKR
jgi:hypothetical protein